MTKAVPARAVIRVSRGSFDPARFDEVEQMTRDTGTYLTPAIKGLQGLISYFAAASPTGSMVHVSIWDSEESAQQMAQLKEMIQDARDAALGVGIQFSPIVNYPIIWHI